MEKVFVGKHIIRMAEVSDIPFIMDFLDLYWEKGCLLSRDRAYFEYEFVVDGRVNFVVAEHKDAGTIDAVAGLIQCSRNKPPDAFGVMWVCKPKNGTKFLGLALGDNIINVSGIRAFTGVGLIADTAARTAKDFYSTEIIKLDHYYRLAHRNEFFIAEVATLRRPTGVISSKKLIPIPTMQHLRSWFDFSVLPDVPIYKDAWYIEHRYFNHPYYNFNIWGIEESPGNITGLLVGRIVRYNSSACLRIVDFFGSDSALDGIGGELDLIMNTSEIEYIDFYCTGVPRENILNAGFVLRDDEDKNIIPNHFEPYEKKNINILCPRHEVRVFKGDGDQGRPKRLRLPLEWHEKTYKTYE